MDVSEDNSENISFGYCIDPVSTRINGILAYGAKLESEVVFKPCWDDDEIQDKN